MKYVGGGRAHKSQITKSLTTIVTNFIMQSILLFLISQKYLKLRINVQALKCNNCKYVFFVIVEENSV